MMKKKKLLGEGIEYKVYNYESNLIIKIPKNLISIIFTYISWHPELLKTPITLIKKSIKTKRLRNLSLEFIQKSNINSNIFGNINILNNGSIIQDRVIELEHFLNNNSEQTRNYIKKYIEKLFELWKFGCSDMFFNLTLNNGVNKNDEVIFLDLGELLTNKEEVKHKIIKKSWIENYSYLDHMNEETRRIFKEEMQENLTIENLEKYWKSELN